MVGDGAQAEGDELGDEDVGVALRGDRREWPDERLAERADERGADEVRILVGKLAARDPVGEDRREVRGVGAAEDEALGLDGRVDRLGEQRPGLAAGSERAAGERLDGGLEPPGAVLRGAASAAARAASTSRWETERKTSANRSALEGKWR